jgi:transcriptional regulator of acetoin/glycerol metabolism
MPRGGKNSASLIPARSLRRTLRRHEGNVSAVARDIGVSEINVRRALIAHRLVEFVDVLRERREARERQTMLDELTRYHGNVARAARALGIRLSSFHRKLKRYRIDVRAFRPAKQSLLEQSKRLLRALRRHHGQMKEVQAELGVSKGTLQAWVRKHDLFVEAESLRRRANLRGTRKHLPKAHEREERRMKLLDLLEASGWRVYGAADKAGVSVGTLYSRMRELGIDTRKQEEQHRMHRLIDALRLGKGVLERAAQVLGVTPRTVSAWCTEFDLNPRNYRAG